MRVWSFLEFRVWCSAFLGFGVQRLEFGFGGSGFIEFRVVGFKVWSKRRFAVRGQGGYPKPG